MCCLFGLLNYSGISNRIIDELVNNLAQEATIRGSDSTGIAYNKNGKLVVYKKPRNAYEMTFKGLESCICVSGHTRHATQGSYLKNYNNHPFYGKCSNMKFALSHNGVLWNDTSLRTSFNLPKDKIETDSYIAVQLLEHFDYLSVENVASMAELVSGSFTFTLTDSRDTLWIVKGDNPLAMVHFPQHELYVYASTKEILFTALCRTSLVDDIANGDFELVEIKSGEIVQINRRGKIKRDNFQFSYSNCYMYDWRTWNSSPAKDDDFEEYDYNKVYLEDIKYVARSMGVEPSFIDELYAEGYTLDELEEFVCNFH